MPGWVHTKNQITCVISWKQKCNSIQFFSCPYFRNEIGGEQEKQIALTRETGKCWGMADDGTEKNRQPCHTPKQARGFCLLEHNSTHWKSGICPYSCVTSHPVVERTDAGSTYYKNFFYGKGEWGLSR